LNFLQIKLLEISIFLKPIIIYIEKKFKIYKNLFNTELNYNIKYSKISLKTFFKKVLKKIVTFKLSNIKNIAKKITKIYEQNRYFFKKHIYTINHKRIALNYLYFSMVTGMSGAALATMIRLEMAYPGSPFFKGDSIKYLQVATAHGLIMIFFVVVPIVFGGFANFLIPYHVGSKDVAFPRLNSIGF
jgi:hypothetical protein